MTARTMPKPQRLIERIDALLEAERELRECADRAERDRAHTAAAQYRVKALAVSQDRHELEDLADIAEDQGLVADPAAMSEEEYCAGLQASAGVMELHHLEVFVREWAARHRHRVEVTDDGDIVWSRIGLRLVSGGGGGAAG